MVASDRTDDAKSKYIKTLFIYLFILHAPESIAHPDRTAGLRLDLLDGHPIGKVNQLQHTRRPVHVEHRHVRDDLTHRARTRERQRAFAKDLRAAILAAVVHRHYHLRLVRVRNEIHGTPDPWQGLRQFTWTVIRSHTFQHLARNHKVRNVTRLRHLHGLQITACIG